MSTLEKFGILVILILVVIIGVVAVWGVGGEEVNPFDAARTGDGATVAEKPADGVDPAAPGAVDWPGAAVPAADAGTRGAPVPPPALGASISPAAPPAGPAAPAVPGGARYRIKQGDTGASIAKAMLGDANRWKEIEAANPGLNARRLKIGAEIVIPNGSAVANSRPAAPRVTPGTPAPNTFLNPNDGPTAPERPVAAPTASPDPAKSYREIEVRSGDTLYEIARRELGNPDLYFKIIQANPGIDPKRIKPGQKVRIPVDG
ncbi:MAG TPA: LysM peptidoglycan-binding domain-containing protein [Planctomycetota bacterium]|nr:LysM peptidoglycan-binding domain-containing protein [Planctomycetota bacterium]